MDFGIARLVSNADITSTQTVMGTPAYMAPEQIQGDTSRIDRRTDVYGMGATLYHLLTHRPLFEGTSAEVLGKLVTEDPVVPRKIDPNIPRDLETIVLKCLEREPIGRYESARALADDLKSYLDGDPIQAHRAGWSYRLLKKAKKNKVMMGIVAASFLVVMTAASFGIYAWWRTSKQIRLAQEFSQSVEAMDWIMRVAHMSPLHDVRKEKAEIKQRMKLIEQKMKEAGRLGIGPGNYSIGKGYVVLQDFQKAKFHLEKSWQSGYQTPSAAYAMGLTLGALYQQELLSIDKLRSKELREHRKQQIEKTYRQSALQYLKASKGVPTQAPEYVEALMLYYDKNFPQALKKTQIAFQKVPWFYEAKILEGNIYYRNGREKIETGDYIGSLPEMHAAELAFKTAVEIGESDVMAYQGICRVRSELFQLEVYGTAKNLESLKNNAATACNQAILADAENADAYNAIARLHLFRSENLLRIGGDSSESNQNAIDNAEKAIHVAPQNPEGYTNAGLAFWMRAKSEMLTGKDATKSLQQALDKSRPGLEIDPTNLGLLNQMGVVYLDRGQHELATGKDPRRSFQEAIRTFTAMIQIKPDFYNAQVNLGITYFALGRYEMKHGLDALVSLTKSVESLQKAREINPVNIFSYRVLIAAYSSLGDLRVWLGRDPSEDFKRAKESFEAGKKLNPEDADLYRELSFIYITNGELKLQKKDSPLSDLLQARELAANALKFNPADTSAPNSIGETYLMEARWQIQNGQNPKKTLAEARTAFEEAKKHNPAQTDCYVGIAEHYYWLAYSDRLSIMPARAALERGLEQIHEAMRLNPNVAEVYGCQTMLLSLKASLSRNENEKRAALDAAENSYQKAVLLNKYLASRYRPYLSRQTN